MKSSAAKFLTVALLCLTAAFAQIGAQESSQQAQKPLTNASVIKLVRAGFREKTVIAIIGTRPARFDLSPERLIELKKSGVSERVILAMIARDSDAPLAEDDWGVDDPFFKQGAGANDQSKRNQSDETNIFGSSGNSRGSVRSRGMNGGSEGETETTGSATVRILRPQAESGGASTAKLERTPTLTNESVVELIEAGFTEGTIIRRIEQSPADFDLAPEKLSELRRRRVTEPVINAMRAAMSEGESDGGSKALP